MARRSKAGLEVVRRLARLPAVVPHDAEDRADADADVAVGRAVERIEHDAIAAALVALAEEHRLLVLFGSEDGDVGPIAETAHDDLVGDHVELLLHLTVRVDVAVLTEHVLDTRTPDLVGDRLAGERDGRQNPRKIARGVRVQLLLGQDVGLQRRQVVGRVVRAQRIDRPRLLGGGVDRLGIV